MDYFINRTISSLSEHMFHFTRAPLKCLTDRSRRVKPFISLISSDKYATAMIPGMKLGKKFADCSYAVQLLTLSFLKLRSLWVFSENKCILPEYFFLKWTQDLYTTIFKIADHKNSGILQLCYVTDSFLWNTKRVKLSCHL